MKKFLFLVVFCLSTTKLFAGEKKLGAGIFFGEPTGLTAKYFFKDNLAGDMNISYSFFKYMHIYADALWHFHDVMRKWDEEFQDISLYAGAGLGLRVSSKDTPKKGDERSNGYFRFPFGMEYFPHTPPLGVYLEIAPGMGFVPKVFGMFQGGIGLRYYF